MLDRYLHIIVAGSVRSVIAVTTLLFVAGCSGSPFDPNESPDSRMLLTGSAPAFELIAVEIDGNVTAVTDPSGYLQQKIGVGDPIVGLFVYDETASDQHPQPNVGRYRFQNPRYMVGFKTGRLSFASDPANVDITIKLTNDKKTNVLKDQYGVKSTGNRDVLQGVGVATIDILLVDESATALSSDSLANQNPYAATWLTTRTLTVTGVDGWTVEAQIELVASSNLYLKPKGDIENFRRK